MFLLPNLLGSYVCSTSSDDTLMRYLRARDGDETAALALLQSTLEWRADFLGAGPAPRCTNCEADPTAHCFLHLGIDAAGDHVVYSCAGRARNKDVHANCRHMACELERIFDGNRLPGRMVWLIDFRGFGVSDCNPRMGANALPMFANHYPERMAKIVCIDPPRSKV